MLQPRTRRDPNRPRPQWKQRRHYSDHLGNPVVLEEYIKPNEDPEPGDQLAIQVYSTVPLDEDHKALREYLLSSWATENPKPLFEIYSYYPSNAFACIEHHRREIAYRKLQHIILGTPDPAPLIPLQFHAGYKSPIGCCILLNSHSYRLGYNTDDEAYEAAGQAPDWLYFNRTFGQCLATVDKASRISSAQPRELYPEAFEMEIMHVRCQDTIGNHLMLNIFGNRDGFGPGRRFIRYGIDVREGDPPEPTPPSEEEIRGHLDQQLTDGNFVLEPAFRLSHGDDPSVTVTNTLDGAEPDLQYLLYAPFLSHLRGDSAEALLESTARLFTAALVAHLPPAKTLHLELRIPASDAWSAILPAHRDALRRHGDGDTFPIGALYTLTSDHTDPNRAPAPHRISPQRRSDGLATALMMLREPYRVFAVVLDKARFVREAGVCFYMTDYDESKEPDRDDVSCPNTQVWRSAGMSEVARRLAMLAVEEEQNGVEETRHLLPPE